MIADRLPPPQKVRSDKSSAISSFVKQAVTIADLTVPSKILDLPCGTGRHSSWLAELGHKVTACDIDSALVSNVVGQIRSKGYDCTGLVADASLDLPFAQAEFDAVLIVDFVLGSLLKQIGQFVAPGGVLIYQSYAGRGQNWKQLLPPGYTIRAIEREFEIVEFSSNMAGPTRTEAESVRLIGRKRRASF